MSTVNQNADQRTAFHSSDPTRPRRGGHALDANVLISRAGWQRLRRVSRRKRLAVVALAVGALAFGGCAEQAPPPGNAPNPAGNARLPLDEATGKKSFGFSDSAFSGPEEFNPGQLGTQETVANGRAAGANSTRLVLQWRLAEPAEGQWDEDYIGELREVAEGFRRPAVITLAFAPRWANPGVAGACPRGYDCRYPPAGNRLDAWQKFVARALREFPNAEFEVWNEPNLSSFWFPAIDSKAYTKLVKSTWEVVKRERDAGRTKAKVLAGSLAQLPDNGSRTRLPWHFLQEMYDAGLKGHYDAVSWHSYAYQTNDEVESLGAKSNFARDWQLMRKAVADNDPGKRFWITETGITRAGKGTTTSDANQAKQLLGLVRTLLSMRDVDGVYVHTLFLWAIFDEDTREGGFGLIRAPKPGEREAKPAYCALVRAARGSSGLCR